MGFHKKRVPPSNSTQKMGHFKKKSRSFRPFLTDFEVKIPKNTKKSTFLTKNFFRGVYKVDFFEILSNEFLIKTFFQGAQLCARNFSGVWDTLVGIIKTLIPKRCPGTPKRPVNPLSPTDISATREGPAAVGVAR